MSAISARIMATDAAFEAIKEFVLSSRYAARKFEPGVCDFTFGNPHEMPIEGIVSAIRERAIPHNKNWFAYKTNEEDLYLAVSIWPFIAKHEANDYRGAHPAAQTVHHRT